MTLTVCLLARNEEKNIGRAIQSVTGLAAQVLVADTGSADRTAAVAAELGADVRQFTWTEDFAAGCNFMLGQATGDWILWLNPQEELLAASQDELRGCLAREDAFAYGVWMQEIVHADQPDRFMETVVLRLFRRHPDVRFVGRAYPDFVTPLQELAHREGKQVYPSEIRVRHHAYLSPLTETKLRWIAHLLELELQDRPGQLPYLIEYGHLLLRLKDPRGHDVLAEAARQLLPVRDAPQAPAPSVQRLLEYLMTVAPEQSQSPLSREETQALALRWFPASPPMLWRVAEQLFQARQFGPAAQLLEQLVRMQQTGAYDRTQAFDPGILGDAAGMNLGLCALQLGQLDRAERCFRALTTSSTHAGQAGRHLAQVQRLRGEGGGAGGTFWVGG